MPVLQPLHILPKEIVINRRLSWHY
uniref:Uncharacterized protein n=1 Tax=Arundo donax TaxID=35708 RepID=A0A0A9EJ17_ARUDO